MRRSIFLLFVLASVAAAQQFEVASVRLSGPQSPHGSSGGPESRTGKYSFEMDYTVDLPGSTPEGLAPAPSMFTAVQKELGLQLISKKLPFDVVVVDSVNRMSTEN